MASFKWGKLPLVDGLLARKTDRGKKYYKINHMSSYLIAKLLKGAIPKRFRKQEGQLILIAQRRGLAV